MHLGFLGSFQEGSIQVTRYLDPFDGEPKNLPNSTTFTCSESVADVPAMVTNSALAGLAGEATADDGTRRLILKLPAEFDLNRTTTGFAGVLTAWGTSHLVQVTVRKSETEAAAKVTVEDVSSIDGQNGKQIKFESLLQQVGETSQGIFSSSATKIATAPDSTPQREGEVSADSPGIAIACAIHNDQIATRAQWILCQGFMPGRSASDPIDNPYFSLIASSNPRKKTTAERKAERQSRTTLDQ
jgi:hypothetical protein